MLARCNVVKALVILLVTTAATSAGTLESDLAAVRKPDTWPVRETLLGWTPDHRIVYRSLICDPDAGGGRGPYCEVQQCVAAADQENNDCTALLQLDLNEGEKIRKGFTNAVVSEKARRALGPLGVPVAGKDLDTSTMRVSIKDGVFALERRGKAGKGTVTIQEYLTPAKAEEQAEQPTNISGAKVTAVSASRDRACVAVLGHYRFDSHYEAVATSTPMTFAKVLCAAP